MKPLPMFAALFAVLSSAVAADWPQLMGPNQDRSIQENKLATRSPLKPRKVWEIPASGGFSSFVTGGGRAYTVLPIDGLETVVAVDRVSGKVLWRTSFGAASYRGGGERGASGNSGGDGPRSTPAYAADRVFFLGGEFDLHALDAKTGKVQWSRRLIDDFGGSEITWSSAAAPLVDGDRVFVAGGGAGRSCLAFRVSDGELLWQAGSDRATHSTPVLATIHGVKQVLFMVNRGLVSRDPADGRELWHYPFPHRTSTAASPVVWENIVNCSAAYGVGGGACRVTLTGDRWEVEEIWRSPGDRDTAAHWSTAVAHGGFLYGCYGRASDTFGDGPMKCIDIRTGKIQWSQPGFGPGQVILVDGQLVATTDAGQLVVIVPTPAAYREIARAKVLSGKVWSSPAFSDGKFFLRSTTQGVCVELQ